MAAENEQSTSDRLSPPPIFTQEQQQWIEQLISAKTQRQGDTITESGETAVTGTASASGSTASGLTGGPPTPTLPSPQGPNAPNPGNLGCPIASDRRQLTTLKGSRARHEAKCAPLAARSRAIMLGAMPSNCRLSTRACCPSKKPGASET